MPVNGGPQQKTQSSRKGPLRLYGKVTTYVDDHGVGYLFDGQHDFEMHLTDIVSTKAPEVGEEVEFTPQINAGVYRARRIALMSDNKPYDFRSPPQDYHQVRTAIPPASSELVARKRQEQARKHEIIKKVASGRRDCPSCRKAVMPRKVRSGLLPGLQRVEHICPFCRASLDKKPLSSRFSWLLVIGVAVVAYSFFL